MKRDIQIIKDILLKVEEADGRLEMQGTREQIYNAQLAIDQGLLEGDVLYDHTGSGHTALLENLTWSGHDFLDAARNEVAWAKVKEYVAKGGAWTFAIVTEILKQIAIDQAKRFIRGGE